MNTHNAVAFYSALGADEKVRFLALLAHELTVVARDAYEAGGEGLTDPRRLRVINEVQHRVTGELASLLRGDKRYPDDVLVQTVLESADDAALQAHLAGAFARALARTKVAA